MVAPPAWKEVRFPDDIGRHLPIHALSECWGLPSSPCCPGHISVGFVYYSIHRWQAVPSKTKAVGDAAPNHQADAPEYRLDNVAFGIGSEAAA